MPVEKFYNLEDAEEALWNFNPDEDYFKNLREFFKMATTLHPPQFPHGIYKYRTFKEAKTDKEKWVFHKQND